jgi:hypothetical protein
MKTVGAYEAKTRLPGCLTGSARGNAPSLPGVERLSRYCSRLNEE